MTTSSTQIPLQMRREDLASWENWLSRPETSALEQLLVAEPFPEHGAYLWGPGGLGKSHLLQACCEAHGHHARYVPLREFGGFPPDKVLAGAETARVIALDDVDTIAESRVWQEGLFGFFNLCEESGARLLVTASAAPQQLADMLPDLRSRLSSLPVFQMPHFSEEQIADLLRLRGEAIGLQLSEDVMRYCSVRLTRNPLRVVSFVNALDQVSLAQRRAVTVPLVRESGLLHLATGE